MADAVNRSPEASGDSDVPAITAPATARAEAAPVSSSLMEVHAPEHPIHTWREFLRHILIVTVGILIALSLEGLVEWRHHRTLAREARENILREITANHDRVSRVLAGKEQFEREAADLIAFIDQPRGSQAQPQPKELNFTMVATNAASWSTAQATGALAYMNFDEVERYAAIYDLQHYFSTVQQQVARDSVLVGAAPNFDQANPQQLEQWREKVRTRQASYQLELQLADALTQVYRDVLNEQGVALPQPPPATSPAK